MDNYTDREDRQPSVKASGWVTLLRVVAIINIVLGCLLSLILGVGVMLSGQVPGFLGVLLGLLIMGAGVLLSFVNAATIMVFLNMAADIRTIRAAAERRH